MRAVKTTRLASLVLVLCALVALPTLAQTPMPFGGGGAAPSQTQLADALRGVETARAARERFESETNGLEPQRTAARARMNERGRALYRLRRAGMLPVAGGFRAMLSHLSRVERLERMVRRDLTALAFLDDREQALRAELTRAQGEERAAQDRLSVLQEEQRRMRDAQAQQQLFHDAFSGGVYAGMPAVPSGYGGFGGGGYGGYGGFGGAGVGGGIRVINPNSGPTFASQRGRLELPVMNVTSIENATRGEGSGLSFAADRGALVRAVASGRVVYAQRYGVYGNLVIVDHGSDHFSLYGGLGHIGVRNGDTLGRGGAVGTTDGSLFFEVRRGTRSLDTRSWLGL